MQNILLSYLSKQDMDVHPDVLDWKDFYLNYLVCNLNSEQIKTEYLRAKSINTVVLKDKKSYQFTHNLILNNVLTELTYQSMIKGEDNLKIIEVKDIAAFNFLSNVIFETLDIICRNSKSFENLNEINDALDLLIHPLAWKKIYPNAKFTKTCFYNLINVKMRTAQHRQQELENKND